MASVGNAFELLKGAESTLSSKKNKKKNKKEEPHQDNGAVANGGSRGAANGAVSSTGGVVEVYEAISVLERSARETRSISDKCKLWKDWIRQAGEKGSKALKYRDADGSLIEFRQVLLKARALEISLEGAFGQGITSAQQDALAQLLLFFSARLDESSAQALAATLVRLSGLVEDEAVDVKGAAQRAVSSIAASIKGPTGAEAQAADSAVTAWVDRVSKLGATISKEQGMLQKLAGNKGAVSKEHAEMAHKVFRLSGEQFDLLQADHLPATASASASTYSAALDQLRTTINSKLKVGGGEAKGPKGGNSNQSALASLRREDAVLAQQADSLTTQIRGLEAQLRSLRSQQQEVEDKRAQLLQRMRQAGDPTAQGKKGAPSAAHVQAELEVVDTLSAILLSCGGGGEGEGVAAMQAARPTISADYVSAGRQYLEYAKVCLADIPARIAFCKKRVAQAEQLQKLGSKDNKTKDEADKLMADTVRSADDLLRHSLQVSQELNTRYDAIVRSMPDLDLTTSESLRAVDVLLGDIRASYEAVQQAIRPPAPAAAPAPAPTPAPAKAAPGPAKQAPAQRAPAAAQPALPAQPAPAPAPAAPAPADNSAFAAAAAFLASVRPTSAPIKADAGAAAPKPAAAAVARPASGATASTSSRQWGKPAGSPAAAGGGDGLPTPAEAFKQPSNGPAPADGEPQVKRKPNRQKA